MVEYYTINKASKILRVTPQTLRNWDKSGKLIPDKTAENGYRYYLKTKIDALANPEIKTQSTINIGYCRVKSKKQQDELNKQIENIKTYMYAKGYQFKIITDIGYSVDYSRAGLKQLIHLIVNKRVDKIVVLSKSCLLGFGYELLEEIATSCGTTIEIIDTTQEINEQELVNDIIAVLKNTKYKES